MSEVCFVLFSLCKTKRRLHFDPILCGIFLDKEEAKKSEKILIDNGNYLAFILEMPVSKSSIDWHDYAKKYIKQQFIKRCEAPAVAVDPNLKIEYKINRKKVIVEPDVKTEP